jgi:hypothetical protein
MNSSNRKPTKNQVTLIIVFLIGALILASAIFAPKSTEKLLFIPFAMEITKFMLWVSTAATKPG